jgi:hypothetical protein
LEEGESLLQELSNFNRKCVMIDELRMVQRYASAGTTDAIPTFNDQEVRNINPIAIIFVIV